VNQLYTASWAALHRHRDRLDVQPVRISRAAPKFWPEAADFPVLDDLMPAGWTLGAYAKWQAELGPEAAMERFGRCYRQRLHVIGFEAIRRQLDALARTHDKPLVLACFEADPATCHRGPTFGFAAWWLGQCGELIAEWEPLEIQMSFDVQTTRPGLGAEGSSHVAR
jgi:hypothetical protein